MPRSKLQLLSRLAGDDRDDPRRLGDVDLDPRQQPVHLDRANHSAKAVARRELLRSRRAFETLDLGGRDDAPVGRVALDADLPRLVPAPERVERDPERAGGLARP